MIPEEQQVTDALAAAVARIDAVLRPWGFIFTTDEVRPSHYGYYASGYYCREMTRIGISCRASIDNIYYEHSFVKEIPFSKEIERFTIGHLALMKALGRSNDCHFVCGHRISDAVVARDGGDRIDALIHDLSAIAASVLREPCEEFFDIMRRGCRTYSIAKR
jgi:hypothetical protein